MQEELTPRAEQPYPDDDLFLEQLFQGMCQNIPPFPFETFVDQARRWTEAINQTAALKPRNQEEWQRAAGVTMTFCFAADSCIRGAAPNLSDKQRRKYQRDYRQHYELWCSVSEMYNLLRSYPHNQ